MACAGSREEVYRGPRGPQESKGPDFEDTTKTLKCPCFNCCCLFVHTDTCLQFQ